MEKLSQLTLQTSHLNLTFSHTFFGRAKKLGEKLSVYKLGSDSNFLERLRKNLFSEYLSTYIKYVHTVPCTYYTYHSKADVSQLLSNHRLFFGSTYIKQCAYNVAEVNRPFPSYPLPLCQNESPFKTIHMRNGKISSRPTTGLL